MCKIDVNDKNEETIKKLSLCSSKLNEIGETSLGIELYFRWLKHFGITFFIMSMISSTPIVKN